jgi:hypothetical protein
VGTCQRPQGPDSPGERPGPGIAQKATREPLVRAMAPNATKDDSKPLWWRGAHKGFGISVFFAVLSV